MESERINRDFNGVDDLSDRLSGTAGFDEEALFKAF